MADLISRAEVLDVIEALQRSPWYGDEKDTAYHHRYLTRKEAVEIVRDLAVKSIPTVDAIPMEWLQEKANGNDLVIGRAARFILRAWGQEAHGT